MSELNQLYCPGCRCPRSIFQFPLKDGWRTATCGSCLERQALRYAAIQGREREGREGEGEGEGEGEQATGPQTRCSSCLQVRDLGRFLTCEPCRRRNLKAKRHRALITRVPNPSPTRAELADHIQRRQQATGKRERGFAGYRAITVDDYTREPTQEEEQELQDRQQQRRRSGREQVRG
ncbi:uncharacterized protein K444DRAFT_16459 [Hyaloscypha bicolor E]|uniref:Stc1 domain-containing protein n=1 Tax=Hyaloscypha bicolor E TaxID=1095630 RepID=A0A2J6TWZ5_9HELO|nr:uncharacterized protein K444DRAFT_16459 [Hyaloscypha bicolor E]PMD67478.1 hypothetical protein K444DRAFT_16459 [Hyaloscypha bicolor E]